MNGSGEKMKFLLNWNHFPEHISNCMSRLMTDSSYSDVIIATGDKRMIYAHRFVLANSSKYFQRLLKQMNKQKGVQLVVALPEVKYDIFKILMNYMYRGESQVPHELLPSVIKMGRILEINGLIDLQDSDGATKGLSILNFCKEEQQSSGSVIRSSRARSHDERRSEQIPCPRERLRFGHSVYAPETKRKRKCQNVQIDSTSESSGMLENGIFLRFRPILPKNEGAIGTARKETTSSSAKRKTGGKDSEKETPSSSTENSQSKKSAAAEEASVAHIKHENIDYNSWGTESQPEEDITIKTEAPYGDEEINYSELLCDYCNENYLDPSEWVRHMSDHHGDRGYQTLRPAEKECRKENVYTCVICSTVLLSAGEWARHLRVWHNDTDSAKASRKASAASQKGHSKEAAEK